MWPPDEYPLIEEIGNPELFTGREPEMARRLDWTDRRSHLCTLALPFGSELFKLLKLGLPRGGFLA